MSKNLYCIHLTGQGDTEIKLVSKAVWDWINSRDLGRPEGGAGSHWIDQLVPKEVTEYHAREGNYEAIYITIGSFDNDRALNATPIKVAGREANFFHIAELINFCRIHDIDIIDTYEGCIY